MGAKNRLWELNLESLKRIFGVDFQDDKFSIRDLVQKDFLVKLGLRQGIIYNYDSVLTDNIEDFNICLDNMMEGRFFNERIEIRIFNDEDKLRGSIFVEELDDQGDDDYINGEYILYDRNNDKTYAERLKIKQYIDYDEDKQAYIYYTKPSKLIFGGEKK